MTVEMEYLRVASLVGLTNLHLATTDTPPFVKELVTRLDLYLLLNHMSDYGSHLSDAS